MTGQLDLVAILTPAEGKLQAVCGLLLDSTVNSAPLSNTPPLQLQDTLTSLVETVKGQEPGIRKWELYVDEKTGEIVTIEM